MSRSHAPLLEAVAEVARVAGAAALQRFRPGIEVEIKPDGSPVTLADRAAESAARAWIEARFPEDGILGEEFGETRPGAARRWILDPIDGTKSFVRGVPLWGSLVAIAEGERVLAGAADFPALNERIAAAVGEGCWWNGARCRVSDVATLAGATVLTTDERFRSSEPKREDWLRVVSRAGLSRTWGDCYGYMLVATGRAEAMMDPRLAPWDAATFMPILEEAGGRFTDWNGRPTAFGGSAVATNAGVSDELRKVLANGKAG
jgi:histidinol phosphatase-like enzyme (inositol monophosphatase family)